MSIRNPDSRRWRVALGLALALALLVPGTARADDGAGGAGQCRAAPPADSGVCGVRKRIGTTVVPAPGGVVNVAVGCGGTCAAIERAASGVGGGGGDGASWPAWAIAHLAAEDAMRLEDHRWHGILMLCAGVFAAALGLAAAFLAMAAIRQSVEENGLRFTSHWGGFGGSTGGWHVTTSFVCLLGAAVLATASAVIFGCMLAAPTAAAPAFSLAGPTTPAASVDKPDKPGKK